MNQRQTESTRKRRGSPPSNGDVAAMPQQRSHGLAPSTSVEPLPAPNTSRSSDGSIIEVRVRDTLFHIAPPPVARSLRYLLAGSELSTSLAVTSAIHGEGVTSISRSLASLIAHDWEISTCWVDLNFWKTKTSIQERDMFPTTLADVIEGRRSVDDLVMPTSIPNLSLVSAGDAPTSSRSRFARSEVLASTIGRLSQQFEFMIFDLPPVLATSDALTLGGMSQAYLLVVRQRATSSAQVRAALRTMTTVPCLGTILNDARSRVPRWMRTSNEVWALGERT